MVYIFNKYISPKENLKIGLTKIYGIGKARALEIAQTLCINPNVRFNCLTSMETSQLIKHITRKYVVGSFLQKEITGNIQKYINIRHYRGIRHAQRLPVRGQRTHTNARTQRKMGLVSSKKA